MQDPECPLDSDENLASGTDLQEASDDSGRSEDDQAFREAFAKLNPKAVENLLSSIKSHELFPHFEASQVGSSEHLANRCDFGTSPVEDVMRWNSWLDGRNES